MTKSAIKKIKERALNNDHAFHVGAALYRKKNLLRIGVNAEKTHPGFKRVYKNGQEGYCLHAEMDVLRFAKPGDRIIVMRWSALGERTMAKPCTHCQEFILEAGITDVTYSDWDGSMKSLDLENDNV